MQKLVFALAAAFAAALILAASAFAVDATVRIQQTGFTPLSVSVERGDAVTWRNLDSVNHQVVADNGAFRSPVLEPGWTTVRFVRLDALSAATFTARLPRGAIRVRMVVPASPGYLAGISNIRIVRR